MAKEFWKKKKVIVTGANGFIGSWLCRALTENGANATAIVRDGKDIRLLKNLGIEKKLDIINADITIPASVENAFEGKEYDYCFHLAAKASAGKSRESRALCLKTNAEGTLNLCNSARWHIKEGIILASTTKVYGNTACNANEEAETKATDAYSLSKLAAEETVLKQCECSGLHAAVIRTSNVFGGNDFNRARLVPSTIFALRENRSPVIEGNGSSRLDFIFVQDAVDAYVKAAEAIEKISGLRLNVAAGSSASVADIVWKIISASKSTLRPKFVETAAAKRNVTIDISKAKKMLSWRPAHSLEEGIKETMEWYENHFSRK